MSIFRPPGLSRGVAVPGEGKRAEQHRISVPDLAKRVLEELRPEYERIVNELRGLSLNSSYHRRKSGSNGRPLPLSYSSSAPSLPEKALGMNDTISYTSNPQPRKPRNTYNGLGFGIENWLNSVPEWIKELKKDLIPGTYQHYLLLLLDTPEHIFESSLFDRTPGQAFSLIWITHSCVVFRKTSKPPDLGAGPGPELQTPNYIYIPSGDIINLVIDAPNTHSHDEAPGLKPLIRGKGSSRCGSLVIFPPPVTGRAQVEHDKTKHGNTKLKTFFDELHLAMLKHGDKSDFAPNLPSTSQGRPVEVAYPIQLEDNTDAIKQEATLQQLREEIRAIKALLDRFKNLAGSW
ncbi:hypothetical protein FQN54_009637 [Arachnomyces sp. PD_36]|nr:hypothetical protein FQN54_009637 [Arachnomyces sp. PD_36]